MRRVISRAFHETPQKEHDDSEDRHHSIVSGFVLLANLATFCIRVYCYRRAGGCALTQTLIEGGLRTLLVERGSAEKLPESENIIDAWDALRSECAEVIRSEDDKPLLWATVWGEPPVSI